MTYPHQEQSKGSITRLSAEACAIFDRASLGCQIQEAASEELSEEEERRPCLEPRSTLLW